MDTILKGLTAQDRANWEKEHIDALKGYTPEEIDDIYVNYNFRRKYGSTFNEKKRREMSISDKINYWNQQYDDSIKGLVETPIEGIQADSIEQKGDATQTISPLEAITRFEDGLDPRETKDIFRENSEVFQARLHRYDDLYNRNVFAAKEGIEDIKDLARKYSNYYRKYQYTDYIQFDDSDWEDISKQYKAYQDAYGEEKAAEYLQRTMYDEVDRNTSWLEDQASGFLGMGASAAQFLGIFCSALPAGIIDYAKGNHEIEGASGFTEFIDAVIDNPATRYFNDVKRWGTFFPERQQAAKELGISELQIMDSYDVMMGEASLGERMFNENTLAHLIDQYGFSAATMMVGGLTNKLTSSLFKGYKGWRYSQIMSKTGSSLQQAKETINKIQSVQNVINRYLIPGIVGQGEAIIEGLQTKLDYLEEAKPLVDERYQHETEKKFQELMDTQYQQLFEALTRPKTYSYAVGEQGYTGEFSGGGMTAEEANKYIVHLLWEEAQASLQDEYQQSIDHLDYNAARAARGTFILGSAVNGIIYSTFKAAMLGNNTLERMRSGKLARFFNKKPTVNVTADGKATGKMPALKTIYEVVYEPTGEGIEEGAQYIISNFSKGRGLNNIMTFLDYKYGGGPGQKDINVGHVFWEDYAAAAAAAGESFAEEDLYLNMFYGAASSILGGVAAPHRARRADGKEGRFFEYGVTATGQKEKWYDVARRIMPWRSGVTQGIDRIKAINTHLQNEAELMQAWLDDPENRVKFDGVNGTIRWANAMKDRAEANDEFGYRNTSRGKAINDAIMLQKLRGTDFYNTLMQRVETAMTLTESSPEARAYIDEFRKDLNNDSENMTDEEIIAQIRKNATEMMQSYEDVQKMGDQLENLTGIVDEDTKEALIYGQMMINDFNERSQQLEEDFRSIKINPIEVTPATDKDGITETLVSEAEIMAMTPIKRMQFLTQQVDKKSEAQRRIIENVIAEGTAKDPDFVGKIKDAGKIEAAQRAYTNEYARVLLDPDTFGKIYVANAKAAAMRASYKKRYESLKGTKDYDTFASEMDRLIAEGNVYERNTILKQLDKDSQSEEEQASNYAKYKKSRQDIANIIEHATVEGGLSQLDSQDIHTFTNAITYLTHKGIDVRDEDAVTAALLEADASGKNLFTSYADSVAPYKGEDAKEITPEQIITLVHDVVRSYNKVEAEQQWRTTPVEVVGEPQENSNPAVINSTQTQAVADEIQGEEGEGGEGGRGTVTSGTTLDEYGNTIPLEEEGGESRRSIPENSVANSYTDISGNDVIDAVLSIEKLINNSSLLDSEKEKALEILKNMGDTPYSTVEELVNIYRAEANKLDIQGETKVAEMIRNVTIKVILDRKEQKAKQGTSVADRVSQNRLEDVSKKSELAKRALDFEGRGAASNEGPLTNPDSNNIQTLSMDNLRKDKSTNPNDSNYSPLLAYWDRHEIAKFLTENEISRDEPIYFIYDPILAQEQKEVWEKGGHVYSSTSTPLVACIKSDKGTVTIDGKKYQPIGIMPRTGAKQHSGSNRLGRIRELIPDNVDSPVLIKDSKGVTLETRLSHHIYAKPPKQIDSANKNISYLQAALNDITAAEREEWNNSPVADRKNTSVYKAIKAKFLSTVRQVQWKDKNGKSRSKLVIDIATHKPGSPTISLDLFFPDIASTKGEGMDRTVGEMIAAGDASVMSKDGNSRLHRWGMQLSNFFKEVNTEGISILPTGELSNSSYAILNNLSKELDKALKRFIFTSRHNIKLGIKVVEGNIQFTIELQNEDDGSIITLGTAQKGELTLEQQFSILQNLIMNNGEVRRNAEGNPLARWQIDFNKDIGEINTSNVAKDAVSKMFDDGIFEVSKERLSYTITTLTFNSPFDSTGARQVFTPRVANKENATTPTDSPQATKQVVSGNAVIDVNTGTVVSGTAQPSTNVAHQEAEAKGKKIEEDSFTNENEFTYFEHGKEYTNPFNDPNAQVTPESTLKQQLVEMFRHIVFGKSFKGSYCISSLLNMTEKSFSTFEAQINAWKDKLSFNGITLLQKEVLATWETEGVKVAIPVALGYDAQGRWKVYVPITNAKTSLDEQMVAMLSQSIEKRYNIKIGEYHFIELSSQMPKGNNITVDNLGRIITNKSHRYDGMRPMMGTITSVGAPSITSYSEAAQFLADKVESTPEEIGADAEVPSSGIYGDGLFGGMQLDDSVDDSFIPESQEWGVFAGRNLDVKATIENLEKNGITEEEWILMPEQEREHELDCKGIY